MKWGTHARVFSQTLEHGNSMNEIRRRDEEGKKRGMSVEKVKRARKKEVPTAYNIYYTYSKYNNNNSFRLFSIKKQY